MTFGPDHYVPVLKVKPGEKAALDLLDPALKVRVTPLLEIVEHKDPKKSIDAHLDTAFKGLAESVHDFPRCFIDTHEIEAFGEEAAGAVFQRATDAGIVFTPVTGISRTADLMPAINNQTNGIALRVTRKEFESGSLEDRLHGFMGEHRLNADATDLIIDLGTVDNFVVSGIAALTNAFLADVPDHEQWRTFTISGCAFPYSMQIVDRHSHQLVERSEWIAWYDNLYSRRGELTRLPTFSDCCIQYPTGVEGIDFRIVGYSAAVRYALADSWLLIKGESVKKILPSKQFPMLATRLVYGGLSAHYHGADHCAGCASMKDAADHVKGHGSSGVWRRLGTVHHITVALQELESLAWT